ncbi:hypothetical protein JN11_01423 [Mucilaginibacter frigoritolerans]|uniref:Tail sheath protein C-terminal domain-containing protein n=1 Tax=Mucilaginibacter frigoritolerans TaxID=652788 RepID=A0A562U9F6_9SPHI|nr:phage tail sheath C-terminal domain-containing protein [Mucilaginibacter frigoritolerans]TWJ02450.1 hypothetical protein JN11_01423 [Mucilaginibacter frigoritolerans]
MSQINESTIQTPGVYINEIPSFPPSIAQVATAIPAFIGYTQKAIDGSGNSLTNVPTTISSMLEYELYFGTAQLETGIQIHYTQVTNGNTSNDTISFSWASATAQSKHIMHSSIRNFYANGGGVCYIVSIGGYKANVGDALVATDFYDLGTGAGLEAAAKVPDVTLFVIPEGQNLPTAAAYYSLQGDALAICGSLQDRFCIFDLYNTGAAIKTSSDLSTAVTTYRTDLSTNSPNYGATYFPNLVTSYAYDFDATQTEVLHQVNGVAGPLNTLKLSAISTTNSAAYNILLAALTNQFPVVLPPSPAIAGVYTSVDGSRGVWKAPANVALLDVTGTTFQVTDALQAGLNIDATSGKSINAIRSFTGKGILVWGARTLDGNSNDFRYISVRRFFIMVEESVKLAAMQYVFEPNDGNTWVKVRAMIENYLTNLWRLGALAGSKPEQSFYVSVGLGQTMTFDDILNGRMIIEVGMAPVRPAEFIILRFTQIQQQS